MEPILEYKDVTVNYGDQAALKNVNLKINSGEIVSILGPNGSGKSTLLKAALGLIKYKGQITVKRAIGYLPQTSDLNLTFPLTVEDVIKMGAWKATNADKSAEIFAQAVSDLGLEEILTKSLSELSGGQLQRTLLARTLLQQAELIFLDEPLNAVDVTTEQKVVELLQKQKEQGKTILITTHDLKLAQTLGGKALFLNKEVIAYGDVAELDYPDYPEFFLIDPHQHH